MNSLTSNAKYPEFFITVNKNRIKHYTQDRKVVTFLKSDSEFELEFNNRTDSYWLCKVSINGKSISDSGLVLEPRSHVYLERYFDRPEKFKFSTFVIDDVEETQAALAQNGLVTVEFFKEIPPVQWPNTWFINTTTTKVPPMVFTNYTNNGQTMSCTTGQNLRKMSRSASPKSLVQEELTSGMRYCSDVDVSAMGQMTLCAASVAPPKVETGRVESGRHSNQSFRTVYKNWEYMPSLVKSVQILPQSRQEVTARELQTRRLYCSVCGVKVGPRDVYCYKCGEKL